MNHTELQEECEAKIAPQLNVSEISNKDQIAKLHEDARSFLHTLGFIFEDDFYETHDKEVIKFHVHDGKKKTKCWLKCCYPLTNGIQGFCVTFGAFSGTMQAHVTRTFWTDSDYQLTDEDRNVIAEGRRQAAERAKNDKKVEDEQADWCLNKYQYASKTGTSQNFVRKGLDIIPSDIRYEIRENRDDYKKETVALIPLTKISNGKFRAIEELYDTKRIFHPEDPHDEPRDKKTLGKYGGCCYTFGKIEDGKPILLGEGFTTTEALFSSTMHTSLMCVTRTNLLNVATEINKKYPNSQITICGDDDVETNGNPGRTDAIAAANHLNGKIHSDELKCRVVFPKFPDGKDRDENGKAYKDFNDLKIISGKDEVKRQIIEASYIPEPILPAKQQKRKEVVPIPQNGLPVVKIVTGQLHNTTNCAEQILSSNDLGVFQRGGQLVRIITEVSKPKKNKLLDKDGKEIIKRSADALLIAEVDPIYLTELLGKHANFIRFDERKGDWVLKDCPDRIAKTLIARREWNVPVLSGIIQAPTLRSDGSILDQPGYDGITGLFFNAGNTKFFQIPSYPTKDEASKALKIILEILKGFPFENDESKSVAVSGILTSVIRKSIRTAPLHGFTAPKMASGKSLLADVPALISTGKSNSVIPQAENEGEEKKRLLSVLAEGDSIICYDNIERPFGSPALCSVLTQEEFKDRLLGLNRSLSVPTNATFLATGNNLTFVGDTSTRAILCRLDPQCERPEERIFDVDLRQYIPHHRAELVKAALTILRAYHVEGRPKQHIPPFGRFEDWSNWVRSSLVWLGMTDPCLSRKEIENSDPVRQSLGNLLATWFGFIGDLSMRAKDIIKKSGESGNEALLDSLMEIAQKDNKICPIRLGTKLKSFDKRIENGFRLQKTGKSQNADLWRVTKISTKSTC